MWLRVVTGEGAGRLVRITGRRFVVGSDPACDLVLHGPGVSPRHAAFEERVGGRFVLIDLGSDGGTFVSTRRIQGPVWVWGVEELCFGDAFAELHPTRAAARRAAGTRRRRAVLFAGVLVLAIAGGATAVVTLGGGGESSEAASTEVAGEPAVPPSSEEELPFAGGSVSEPAATAEPATTAEPETTSGSATTEEPAPTEEPATTEQPATTDAPPATEEPVAEEPGVLFADDFSDPASGWEVFDDAGGSAAYTNGALVIRVKRSSYFATSDSGRTLSRGVVSVEATNRSGATGSGFGIVCRYRNQRNFDLLAAGADGTAAIIRSEEGRLSVLSGGGRWVRSDDVPIGARRYRLRAQCGSDQLRLWVNGRRIVSVTSHGTAGSIGLFAVGEGSIRFDDLVVAETEG